MKSPSITVSAPGKIMLFGEHAVVYGRPCIVTSVDQRMRLTIKQIDSPNLVLHARDVGISEYVKPLDKLCTGEVPSGAEYIEHALSLTLKSYPITKGLEITTNSEFSSKYGFGSSSASTVCVIKAFSELLNCGLKKKDIFNIAYRTVLDIKGVGSGFDIAAAVYGGTLYFVTGGKVIEPLQIESLPLIIGYTGIKADTPTIVKRVAKQKEKNPVFFDHIFNEISAIVEKAKQALLLKKWDTVGILMNENEKLLEQIKVEGEVLSRLIETANKAGAYGAKLSGAGIGDCMIALSSTEKNESIQNNLVSAGGKIVHIKTNAPGVRIENL